MIFCEAIKTLIAILGALIVARVGLYFYFRQKEYELIKERYLEKGVDHLCAEIEAVMNVTASNWGRSLDVLKQFRELGDEFDPEVLKHGFSDYSLVNFGHIANQRVMRLVGGNLTWQIYQICSSTHKAINDKCVFEIPTALRLHSAGKLRGTREELIEESTNQLRNLLDRSDQYASFVASLQDIANELERDTPRSKKIEAFRERPHVKSIMARLEETYAPLLAQRRA